MRLRDAFTIGQQCTQQVETNLRNDDADLPEGQSTTKVVMTMECIVGYIRYTETDTMSTIRVIS
jgi:hypothetical protein